MDMSHVCFQDLVYGADQSSRDHHKADSLDQKADLLDCKGAIYGQKGSREPKPISFIVIPAMRKLLSFLAPLIAFMALLSPPIFVPPRQASRILDRGHFNFNCRDIDVEA